MMELPKFFRVRQQFSAHRLDDAAAAVTQALHQAKLPDQILAGQTVAIAVGSRGIANLPLIVKQVVDEVLALGATAMIIPAMGSHGGATAEGQTKVLASLGISSATMGCPVQASMDTVKVGTTSDGIDVHFDQIASQADHVLLISRIKPHTRLVGKYESGLIKMLMIGLGKHRGAALYHQVFAKYEYQLDRIAPEIVSMILAAMPITLGLAIIEDAYDETSLIQAVAAEDFLSKEPLLLQTARQRMPRLPFDQADLLIVDQIGKEISGTGMDTNVIGRKFNDKAAAEQEFPKVRQIYVRNLTERSAGNASGIGIAEYCRSRVVRAMDIDVTRINCLTSGHPTAAAIPIHFETDRELLTAAVTQAGRLSIDELQWLWIPDTLHISEVACSEAYWQQAHEDERLEILHEPIELTFDSAGDLEPLG